MERARTDTRGKSVKATLMAVGLSLCCGTACNGDDSSGSDPNRIAPPVQLPPRSTLSLGELEGSSLAGFDVQVLDGPMGSLWRVSFSGANVPLTSGDGMGRVSVMYARLGSAMGPIDLDSAPLEGPDGTPETMEVVYIEVPEGTIDPDGGNFFKAQTGMLELEHADGDYDLHLSFTDVSFMPAHVKHPELLIEADAKGTPKVLSGDISGLVTFDCNGSAEFCGRQHL